MKKNKKNLTPRQPGDHRLAETGLDALIFYRISTEGVLYLVDTNPVVRRGKAVFCNRRFKSFSSLTEARLAAHYADLDAVEMEEYLELERIRKEYEQNPKTPPPPKPEENW